MAIKTYKPTTPSRRHMTVSAFEGIDKKAKPERSLIENLKKNAGRNSYGRITVRHRGGGNKRKYRIIDFKRQKDGVEATVIRLEYDPNRSANIALIQYADGEKAYILAPVGLKPGHIIETGAQALKLISLFFVFWGLLYVFRGILNGAGNAGFALVSGILEVVGRMGCAFLLTSIPFIGQWGIWLAEGLTWILVSAAGAICYFRGKWTQKKLIA